ncbi:hypothetical protein DFH09DRAFT_957634 [Mycena vulgaris]|nr:hypothetical protein DFH09DRAFT_957634 [Mycena vulgaris]
MLSLGPGSACDVCLEPFGAELKAPSSIPCGHVFCVECDDLRSLPHSPLICPLLTILQTIGAKGDISLAAGGEGWSTPRRLPNIEANPPDFISDAWSKRLMLADGCSRTRQDVRRLEAKVAEVATKKCSVEEVTTLHKELQEWLTSDARSQTSSLTLSAALLRAILMNHVAHSEASRMAKNVEATLKTKLDDLELMNEKLDAESRRQRLQYFQKAQECQSLRQELSRLKVVSTTLSAPPLPPVESQHRSPSPPPVPPLPSTYNSQAASQSGLARFNSTHMRSASMFAASRPTTPSPGLASSQAPGPMSSTRSETPTPARARTPSPTRTHSMSLSPMRPPWRAGAVTPTTTQHASLSTSTTSMPLRARAPAPPPSAPRPRRLSHPSPPKMATRMLSEEKHDAHQLWLPAAAPEEPNMKRDPFATRGPPRTSQPYMYRYRVEEEEGRG